MARSVPNPFPIDAHAAPLARMAGRGGLSDARPQLRNPGKVIVISARSGEDLGPLQGWIDALGGHSMAVGERLLPLEWIDQYACGFDLAVVDCDHVGDHGDVIDLGRRLRRHAPGLPVIMLSSRVLRDDMTTERMAICDVTLRKPLTRGGFLLAVSAALDNHAFWLGTRPGGRILAPRGGETPPV
jgi:CheY-like chemotaxis protein